MGAPEMRLNHARDAVQAEDARATGLQNRGAVLAAAAGLVLGIALTVGRSLFLRQVNDTIFEILFLATLAVLLFAAALAGFALWPPGSAAASVDDIAGLSDPGQPTASRGQAEVLIDALADQLSQSRNENDGTARRLRWGLALLAVGALGTTVLGATLGISDLKPTPQVSHERDRNMKRSEAASSDRLNQKANH